MGSKGHGKRVGARAAALACDARAGARVAGAFPVVSVAPVALALLGVFLLTLMLACGIGAAHADELETASVDQPEQYGWLTRKGDYWYSNQPGDDPGAPLYIYKDGYVYEASRVEGGGTDEDLGVDLPVEQLYSDGTLVYQRGYHVDIDKIAANPGMRVAYNGEAADFSQPLTVKLACVKSGSARLRDIKTVVVDESFATFVAGPSSQQDQAQSQSPPFAMRYLDGWFQDCVNLEQVDGLVNLPEHRPLSLAYLFSGCERLKRVDLSSFDTRSCVDFTDMFDGCTALEGLTLGTWWTQTPAGGGVAQEQKRAKFSLVMQNASGGQRYLSGSIIPDGAASYAPSERVDIAQADVRLLAPGTFVVDEADAGDYANGAKSYPAGVTAADVYVYRASGSNAQQPLTCEYTGRAIRPSVAVGESGKLLAQGQDYTVSYVANTEVGTARVVVTGKGSCYGSVEKTFAIVDTAAYALLYGDGTLLLKAGHGKPDNRVVSSAETPQASMRWFDSSTPAPGSWVPWSPYKSQVRRVLVDGSFKRFQIASAEGWFAGCTLLRSVEGLANLSLAPSASLSIMLLGCTSLSDCDLSALRTQPTMDFSGMLTGCTGLCTLKFGEGWRNASASARQAEFPITGFGMTGSYRRCEAHTAIPSGAGEYRFRDIPLQLASVQADGPSFDYTGGAITPSVDVMLGDASLREWEDYTLSYANNVYPGQGTVSILGIGAFSGGLQVPFEIKAKVTQLEVGDKLKYRTKKAVFTFRVSKVQKDDGSVVGASATLVKVKVQSAGVRRLVIPSQCTIGGVTVDITAVDSKVSGTFRNVSCVVIGAKVTRIGARAFSRAHSVTQLQLKSKRLKKVKNCLAGSNIYKVTTKCKLSKAKQKKYRKWFTKKSGRQGVLYLYRR